MSASVTELWRYPVKSMGGERIERARLAHAIHRIAGDREWGVVDAATGRLLSAKSVGALLLARARWLGDDTGAGDTAINLPGGATVIAGEPEAERAMSAWLGRAVTLRRAGGTATVTIDMELDDGAGDGPHGAKSFDTHPGLLHDSKSTLHVIGRATLAGFERDLAATAGDVRRYRPNIVVDGPAEAEEDTWVGAELRVGTVIAHVRKRTERCVIVSRAQPGLDRDRALLRHLATRRDMRVGVYLDPSGAGDITVGDRVERVTVAR